ncbi:hypothetical protein K432DRAFT_405566 [Lepidopterella palustris CBS 459.81]|uniref:Uncharacterized protein n=1 Tax=Lepidopterella palustris CBS 459.81 TaxID=1314670 RepID=A0A8E2E8P5_9PEZI|nr:hypothetical protein K432DRAFT_405566 [Lepidopterella palustris CBS 459.81]
MAPKDWDETTASQIQCRLFVFILALETHPQWNDAAPEKQLKLCALWQQAHLVRQQLSELSEPKLRVGDKQEHAKLVDLVMASVKLSVLGTTEEGLRHVMNQVKSGRVLRPEQPVPGGPVSLSELQLDLGDGVREAARRLRVNAEDGRYID